MIPYGTIWYHTTLQTHAELTQVSANVWIRVKYTGTVQKHMALHGLMGTCGKKYATVHTTQNMFSFCGLQCAEPCGAMRNVNMAKLYMFSNSLYTCGTIQFCVVPYGIACCLNGP